jgi:precorrin-4 methylase
VTAAVGAVAYAGIPLTHRRVASSFAVVTGHECGDGGERVDWARLATAVDTLVVLMGVAALPRIARELIAHGRAPGTPVALVRWGTTALQTVLTGRLSDIGARARTARLEPPVVIVIGDVVALADRLAWFSPAARGRTAKGATRPPAGRYAGGYRHPASGTITSPSLWPACPVTLHPARATAAASRRFYPA